MRTASVVRAVEVHVGTVRPGVTDAEEAVPAVLFFLIGHRTAREDQRSQRDQGRQHEPRGP